MAVKLRTALKQMAFMKKHSKNMRLAAEEWKTPFQILISTIMSARTVDETTIPTAEKLFNKYPITEKLSKARLSDVKKIIRPVNFYKNKSRNVIACSKMLVKKHKSKIPMTIEELIELPGVGRKTANVFLSEVGDHAIGIDTHVSYISQKLGWTKNKKPEKIEQDLKKLFPKKHWSKVNATLVRFGKSHTSRKKKDELLEEIRKIK